MAVRTQTAVSLKVGQDSSLDVCSAEGSISELVDTLDHESSHNGTLAALDSNVAMDFGDVSAGKLVYVEADGPLQVTLGGSAAVAAEIDATGGTYVTTFAGGETLGIIVDLTVLAVVFNVLDQTLAQVINRINSFAALSGIGPIAFDNASELRLTSPTTGDASTMEVSAGGTALATLGLTASTDTGVNPDPNTSQLSLATLMDGASTVLKSYAILTVETTAAYLTNPSATTAVKYKFIVVGDFVS